MIVEFDEAPHEPDVAAGVRQLLVEADMEFVPPLSSRADTGTLLAEYDGQDVDRYTESMAKEDWLVAREGADVVGVLSFLDTSGTAYVTTVIVTAGSRRRGVGTRLYEALERLATERGLSAMETRTWSTNRSHLRLLVSRGFIESRREFDERGAGLDTVYQRRDLTGRGEVFVKEAPGLA